MKKEVILFDINETVLNLGSLQPKFKAVFGSEDALSLWFSKLLHSSTVCIATNVKSTFSELANATLDAIAQRYKCDLTVESKDALLTSFANLPPHTDIKASLLKLRNNGFKTVAFSNSSLDLITSQIKNSGLEDYFDTVISVEETGSFKPNSDVYNFAADTLKEPVENLRLVATHDWDTHGALSAGLQAAYIDRTGVEYHSLYLKPEISSKTMDGVVEQIIKHNLDK
ncbi:haloacid dehalogenase type II [Vibrio splendidus]|uniref:haloacid dehalogenase type II n=1 Tax=Vibrio splendidus TaxID=29497 RepID=UPI0002E736DA|nr:haloacid dehalogenase type II [Vibrio splendidus]OED82947.1 haloacid dehalogenase, type II [Vibrio splendidus ZF-90]PTP37597.1 haloacid dehalogenase type II [Vibrio splendidus]